MLLHTITVSKPTSYVCLQTAVVNSLLCLHKLLLKKFALNPDGVFLSNGPGDPAACDYAIEAVKTIVETTTLPVFGICLGHQILALASGAKTMKMNHGHHGANHPVQNLKQVQ
jgi:carbamoylphosphate synthase small subunit